MALSARELPFDASPLSKHDLRTYRPMFGLYLDIQKQLSIDELTEDEIKGRWKSFIGKWNRGELSLGWYDPSTLDKAVQAERGAATASPLPNRTLNDESGRDTRDMHDSRPEKHDDGLAGNNDMSEDDDDEDFGPALPKSDQNSQLNISRHHKLQPGPAIPSLTDLRAQQEQNQDDQAAARQNRFESIRTERRLERKVQKERLDEIAPRAEAGTRERQLEKKRELGELNRAFAAAKDCGGGETEVKEADLMGDEDSLSDLKRMKKEQERKKNDREIRREEVLRARKAEREVRMAGMRAKEEKTVEMLKEIARARFGGGDDDGEGDRDTGYGV